MCTLIFISNCYYKNNLTNIIYYRIERQVVAAGTSVAPPECPAHLQKASVMPPAPTVSSSHARIDREPKVTAVKAITPSDNEDISSGSGSNHSEDHSNTNSDSGTGDDSDSDIYAKPSAIPVRRGPPSRSKPNQHNEPVIASTEASDYAVSSRSKLKQHNEPVEPVTAIAKTSSYSISSMSKPKQHNEPITVMATAETSDLGILDVKMHSPPHALPSQRGRAPNVKPIGGSSCSQLVKSSGASKAYGATIGGRALGNTPNIGDFDAVEDDPPSIDIEGTVNLFLSNTRPTTLDIDETAVIAVNIPFEGALAPLLQCIAKYYSPMASRYFKF